MKLLSSFVILGFNVAISTAFTPISPAPHCRISLTKISAGILDYDTFEFESSDRDKQVAGSIPSDVGVDDDAMMKDVSNLPDDMVKRGDILRQFNFPPGHKILRHSHPESTMHHVSSGSIKVVPANGESKLLKSGDFYIIPGGTAYELEVPGEEEGNKSGYTGLSFYWKCTINN